MPLTVDLDKFNPWPLVQEHVGNLIARDILSGDVYDTEISHMLAQVEMEFAKALTIAFAQGVRYANIQQSKYYPSKRQPKRLFGGPNVRTPKRKR